MGESVINLADYRRPKPKAKPSPPAVVTPVTAVPMLLPMFCGFGWFVLPVLMPMMVSTEFHA